MCRFLIANSANPLSPTDLLSDFATMCKNNSDWQGDGWGVAYKIQNSKFKIQKSLNPIWKDTKTFESFPVSTTFAVHARGASFEQEKGNVDYNQPYIEDDLCFVFNGELYGVKVAIEGEIGAQKIFSLIKNFLKTDAPDKALERVRNFLRRKSDKIVGLNIGLITDSQIAVLCDYDERPGYYTLRYYHDDFLTLVCSEEIGGYNWKRIQRGEIVKF